MNKRAILGEQLHRQFPSCRPHYIPTDLLGMAKNEWKDAWNTANVKTALQTCCCCLLTLPMLNRTQSSSTLWTLLLHTEHLNSQPIKCHGPKMSTTGFCLLSIQRQWCWSSGAMGSLLDFWGCLLGWVPAEGDGALLEDGKLQKRGLLWSGSVLDTL